MGNTLELESTTCSTMIWLNYNNNESKPSVNRRPAMGSTTYTYKNIIVIKDYYRIMAWKGKNPNVKMPIGTKTKAEHTHGVVPKSIQHV